MGLISCNLDHGLDPEAAVDGVNAEDGSGGAPGDAVEEPHVVGDHGEKTKGDKDYVQIIFVHGGLC